MAKMQDVRKTLEASLGSLTPSRAQDMAKSMLDRDAAKEQVSKTAADLMEWSQRNRNRLTAMIRNEVKDQLRQAGVATEDELNALRKRVRDLERSARAAGSSRAGQKRSGAKSSKGATKAKSAAKRTAPPTE
jgi:polyhydroxyalkanoate synthesis regulator phasin